MTANKRFDNEGEGQPSSITIAFLQPCIKKLEGHATNLQNASIRALLVPEEIEKLRDNLDAIREELNEMRKDPSLREYRELIKNIRINIMAACDELSLAVEKYDEDERFDHLRNATDCIERGTDSYYELP